MKKLLLFLLFTSVSGWAQGSFYQLPQPLPNANVRVCTNPPTGNPCAALASIFSDQALTQGIANPFPVGATGNFGFWVMGGQYVVQVGPPYNLAYVISLGGGGAASSITTGTSLPVQPCTAGAVFIQTGSGGNADRFFRCPGSGGSGTWTEIPNAYFPNIQFPNIVYASDYGVVPGNLVFDCSVTSGGSAVTCADGNFNTTCSIGQTIQGGNQTSAQILNPGTITACTDNTHVTVSTTASATATSNMAFYWGPDQTAALQRAELARETGCQFLAIPPGAFYTTQANFNVTPAGCPADGGPAGGVIGMGGGWITTTIIPSYSFSYTTGGPTGTGCTTGGKKTCFFGIPNFTIDYITINGMSGGTNPAAITALTENNGGYDFRFGVVHWCSSCTNAFGKVYSGLEATSRESAVTNAGFIDCLVSDNSSGFTGATKALMVISPCQTEAGGGAAISSQYGLYCQGTSGPSSAKSQGNFFSGSTAAIRVDAQCTLDEDSDSTNPGIGVGAGIINNGTHYLRNFVYANTQGTYANNSGAHSFIENSNFSGRGAAAVITNASGGTIVDQCGNTFGSATISNSGVYKGDGCPAVIVTAAKLVLSAGWGSTAAWSALTGFNNFTGTITPGGAGIAANPTITYTFPTASPVVPQNCQATILKSNDAGVTISNYALTPSALSATGVTWTYTGTPVSADTYIVQGTCTQ